MNYASNNYGNNDAINNNHNDIRLILKWMGIVATWIERGSNICTLNKTFMLIVNR